jgi:hypothetical protein
LISLTTRVDSRIWVCKDGYELVPNQEPIGDHTLGSLEEDALWFGRLQPRSTEHRVLDSDRLRAANLSFAELELNPESYRAFACKYGLLHHHEMVLDIPDLALPHEEPGLRLREWFLFQLAIRDVLGLPTRLSRQLQRVAKTPTRADEPFEYRGVKRNGLGKAVDDNSALNLMIRLVAVSVSTSVTLDPVTKLPTVVLAPNHLHSLMALQTIRDVQEKKLSPGRPILHCAWCGKPFEPAPGGRKNRKYCGKRCANAYNYRRNKKGK